MAMQISKAITEDSNSRFADFLLVIFPSSFYPFLSLSNFD
jgi:hypothetical protein